MESIGDIMKCVIECIRKFGRIEDGEDIEDVIKGLNLEYLNVLIDLDVNNLMKVAGIVLFR